MAHTERLYYTRLLFEGIQRARHPHQFLTRVGRASTLTARHSTRSRAGSPAIAARWRESRCWTLSMRGTMLPTSFANTPAGEAVQGRIDWERRFDHMQQHTGQHILSAAFERTGGYKTVSFHLGTESATIDLDSDRVGAKQIEEAEKLANGVVFENRAVRISFRSAAEAQQLDLRKPTFREGDIRLVEVVGFDLSACGGTHVSGTGERGYHLHSQGGARQRPGAR